MPLALIAAMSLNRVIGREGGLPWSLPDDMAHFKRTTSGHPVIMGRQTLETDAGVLPNRLNIVVTRDESWSADGVLTAASIEAARDLAQGHHPDLDAFVIGGGTIYELALPIADRIELTVVHALIDGDTRFPDYNRTDFDLVRASHHPADDRHAYPMTFLTLRRAGAD